MENPRTPLPEYDAPPVSEVALAVHFAPLERWQSAHAGLYWGVIADDYPQTVIQPPIAPQIERFDEEPPQAPQVQLISGPMMDRYWFITQEGTRLIQVQQDRFIVNWRKVTGDEAYPRYADVIRPLFEKEWRRFKTFVESRKLGSVEVLQCEVTYVNDLVRGQDWSEFRQALELFSYWSGHGSDGFLPLPEMLIKAASFVMVHRQGRLHFNTQRAVRSIDQKEVIKFNLFARGQPKSGSDEDVLAWIDLGREWIVRGFTDLTTKKAHQLWKRRL